MTKQPVRLTDMTTDVGVPAYRAYIQPAPGEPVRDSGASPSPGYAIERSLTELIQLSVCMPLRERFAGQLPPRRVSTADHPRRRACYLADFADALRWGERATAPLPTTPRRAARF